MCRTRTRCDGSLANGVKHEAHDFPALASQTVVLCCISPLSHCLCLPSPRLPGKFIPAYVSHYRSLSITLLKAHSFSLYLSSRYSLPNTDVEAISCQHSPPSTHLSTLISQYPPLSPPRCFCLLFPGSIFYAFPCISLLLVCVYPSLSPPFTQTLGFGVSEAFCSGSMQMTCYS